MRRIIRSATGVATLLAALPVLVPAPVAAQSADTTFFRPAQWGVEFAAGSFNALGLLRFATPTRAWFGSVQGRVQSVELPNGNDVDEAQLSLQLGSRWFKSLGDDLLQHVTVGALISGSSSSRTGGAAVSSTRGTGLGVFGDIGGQWMVTRNLSLGAAYGLTATWGRTTGEEGASERSATQTFVSLGPVSIRGTLYF